MKQNKKIYRIFVLSIVLFELTFGFMPTAYAQTAKPTTPAPAAATPPKAGSAVLQLKDKPLSTQKSNAQQTIEDLLCHPTEQLTGGTAQNPFANPDAATNNAGGDLTTCINRLYKFGIALAAVAAVMFFVIAGYMYAAGGEESVSEAKAILGSTVAGVVVLLISFIFLKTISPDLIQFKPLQLPQFYNTNLDLSLCNPEQQDCVVQADGSITQVPSSGGTGGGGKVVPSCTSGLVTLASLGIPTTKSGAQICKELGGKLATAYKNRNGVDWVVTATIESGHESGCHAPGDPKAGNCADIAINGNPRDVNLFEKICASLKAQGLTSIANEIAPKPEADLSKYNTPSCGNAVDKTKKPYDQSSDAPSLHVNYTGDGGGTSSGGGQGVGLSLDELKALQASFERDMASSGLGVVLRSQWGAGTPFVDRLIERNPTVQYVVIHHTADIQPDGSNAIKSIEQFQTVGRPASQGGPFADIAYHFLISPDGKIYQGRMGGPEVKGAHFHGVNDGNIGVAMMGNFNTQTITPQAKASLTKLVVYIKGKYGINYGGSTFVPKANANMPNLAKHSDINGLLPDKFSTECPGKNLVPVINELAKSLGMKQDPNDIDQLALR